MIKADMANLMKNNFIVLSRCDVPIVVNLGFGMSILVLLRVFCVCVSSGWLKKYLCLF